ncbi:MAG: hypothetical protein MZV63_57470 [Marinilabiliales bacterium]|nr:hypothetical protein [Marinilabiliales bacterium]
MLSPAEAIRRPGCAALALSLTGCAITFFRAGRLPRGRTGASDSWWPLTYAGLPGRGGEGARGCASRSDATAFIMSSSPPIGLLAHRRRFRDRCRRRPACGRSSASSAWRYFAIVATVIPIATLFAAMQRDRALPTPPWSPPSSRR